MSIKDDIKFVFNELEAKGGLDRWVYAALKKVEEFAKLVQPQSPYKDPAKFTQQPFHGKFWIGKDYDLKQLYIYGVAPNPQFIKGAKAPHKVYHSTKTYTYHNGNRFFTTNKAQTLAKTIGIDTKETYYYGDNVRLYGFFTATLNGKKLIFGRNEQDAASTIYAKDSFADYLVKNFSSAIDKLIFEAGQDILAKAK